VYVEEDLSKEELLKIVKSVREVGRKKPGRPVALVIKAVTMTKQEIEDVLREVSPELRRFIVESAKTERESHLV